MKKMIIIITVILVLLISISLGKNVIARKAVSTGVKAITGLKLNIRRMDVGIIKTFISIKGLELFNPSGFKDKLMVDMPEIYVDYDLAAFLKGKVHFEKVKLNLKEFVVVKNQKGDLNLDSLKTVKQKEKTPKEKTKMPEIQIDILELKIGKVIYKDYSDSGSPKVREFNVNIDERHENITDPRTLANLIVFKALMNTSIASLANFDVSSLSETLGDSLRTASEIFEDTAGVALETGARVTDAAKETTEKAKETIENILPFGKAMD